MAKGNPLLGQMRGKVGDLVFSRSAGQQVVRARAAKVANPQTRGQMIQRIIMATVAQAYSRMAPITDHSFEGVQKGQKSMSYFMSKNIAALQTAVGNAGEAGFDTLYSFCPIGSNIYAPNVYMIAKGSLPEVKVTMGTAADNNAFIEVATNTYQGVVDALGLQQGDQLTFVNMHGTTAEQTSFSYARVILSPSSGDMTVPFVINGAVNAPNIENEGEIRTLAFADGKIKFNLAGGSLLGAAVIVSRKRTDGSWLRSNSSFVLGDWAAIGYSLGDCLNLLEQGVAFYGSQQYLNNANTQESGSITVKNKAGNDRTMVAVKSTGTGANAGYVVCIDDEGDEFVLKNAQVSSHSFNNYLVNMNGYDDGNPSAWGNAPQIVTDDNTIDVATDTETAVAFFNWLVSKGVSWSIWVTPA